MLAITKVVNVSKKDIKEKCKKRAETKKEIGYRLTELFVAHLLSRYFM